MMSLFGRLVFPGRHGTQPWQGLLLAILGWMVASALSAQENGTSPDQNYELRTGDVVRITVFNEPDLSVEQKLDPDGVMIVPLLGRVSLTGVTARDAETKLEQLFISEEYLISPQVTVTVTDYAEQVFYIHGEVRQPGAKIFPQGRQSLDILEAITLAGDLTQYAKRGEIIIRRPLRDSNIERKITVDLDSLLKGNNNANEELVNIYPDDRIYVPERLF